MNFNPSAASSEYYRNILDAMPCPVFVVEEDVRIVDFNTAASAAISKKAEEMRRQKVGDALHCIHSGEAEEGCGKTFACKVCPIRISVNQALEGERPPRQTVKVMQATQDGVAESIFLVTVAPLLFENVPLALVILEDIREITLLQQMLPICSHCKQVRSDENYWQSVESYLSGHLEIHCTHSLCPDCAEKFFPEFSQQLGDSADKPGQE